MTHTLGYFGPDPTLPRRQRRPSYLLSILLGAILGLAVLCLLILASMAATTRGRPEDARVIVAKTDVANYSTVVDKFALDTGRYPTEAEGLDALASQPAGLSEWNGPYLQQVKTDPWGRPYVYHLRSPNGGPGYRIVSKGPDGLAGTSDDIEGNCDVAPGG